MTTAIDLASWTAAVDKSRADHLAHTNGARPPNHRCPYRLAAKAEHAAVSKRARDRKKAAR